MQSLYGQNIFDIVVAETGNINNLFQILSNNLLNPDDIIKSGQQINIPQTETEKETFIITSNPEVKKEYYTQFQQNIFDLTCQYYGDISFLFDFIADNTFDLTSIMQTGQKIILHNANKGNEKVKKFIILNRLIFTNQGDVITRQLTRGKAFSKAFSKAFH
jgi:hypothetical protein